MIQDLAPTPATQRGHVPGVPVPDGALISDDEDDSFIAYADTESEGDFGGDNAEDDDGGAEVNIPNEGAQIPNNNFATDGEGRRSVGGYIIA